MGIVNAGGDLAVFGAIDHGIRVQGPAPSRLVVDAGSLRDGAIATSSFSTDPGSGSDAASPLVLPSPGPSMWSGRSVSVVAPRCLIADALTKVVAALGPRAKVLLERHEAHAFSVDGRGRLERVC